MEGEPFPCYRGAGLPFRSGFLSYGDCPPHCYGEIYGGPSFHHWDVPPFVFPCNCVPVAPDLGLHDAASVASSLGDTGAPLGSLLHMTMPPPLASNILMLSSMVSGYNHLQHFGQQTAMAEFLWLLGGTLVASLQSLL